MLHPFDQTAAVFNGYWATAKVTDNRRGECMTVATRLLRDYQLYKDIEDETGVPAIWTMSTNERESGGRTDRYLGNGDPLNKKSVHVPRGRGPFTGPLAFVNGAKDAFSIDGIALVKVWNPARACFEWVTFNGWGYGTASPYLLAGTNLQKRGKYTDDGHYDPNAWDTQLGCIAIAWGITQRRPELALGGVVATASVPDHPQEQAAPITVGGSTHDTRWLQAALNQVAKDTAKMKDQVAEFGGHEQLLVDGNYGFETRLFVRAFETVEGLTVDRGFVGPQVYGALGKVLGDDWRPTA